MSVLARLRKLSQYEFYTNALKLARLASEGTISLKDFQTQYKSWRGDKQRYHAYHTLRRLDSEERKLAEWIKSTHSTQTA
jgi:hypothetical protein